MSNYEGMKSPIELLDLQFADGYYTPDNAPIFYRRKKSLQKIGVLDDLKLHDSFYVELWDGPFAGKCYLMKVIRVRKDEGCYDCLWLNKEHKLLRNIVGRAMFSCIANATTVYARKQKKCKRNKSSAMSEEERPDAKQSILTTPSGDKVTPKKEPFPKRIKMSYQKNLFGTNESSAVEHPNEIHV